MGDFVGDRLHPALLQVHASARPTTGLACRLSQTDGIIILVQGEEIPTANINQVRGVETTSTTARRWRCSFTVLPVAMVQQCRFMHTSWTFVCNKLAWRAAKEMRLWNSLQTLLQILVLHPTLVAAHSAVVGCMVTMGPLLLGIAVG